LSVKEAEELADELSVCIRYSISDLKCDVINYRGSSFPIGKISVYD